MPTVITLSLTLAERAWLLSILAVSLMSGGCIRIQHLANDCGQPRWARIGSPQLIPLAYARDDSAIAVSYRSFIADFLFVFHKTPAGIRLPCFFPFCIQGLVFKGPHSSPVQVFEHLLLHPASTP